MRIDRYEQGAFREVQWYLDALAELDPSAVRASAQATGATGFAAWCTRNDIRDLMCQPPDERAATLRGVQSTRELHLTLLAAAYIARTGYGLLQAVANIAADAPLCRAGGLTPPAHRSPCGCHHQQERTMIETDVSDWDRDRFGNLEVFPITGWAATAAPQTVLIRLEIMDSPGRRSTAQFQLLADEAAELGQCLQFLAARSMASPGHGHT